ncbi:MAG: hypothetical protein WC055_01630 [Melioribacteraceae bacterium]
MGTQQLLVIIVGTIAVGLMIAVGINIYNEYSIETSRNEIVSQLQNLCVMAQMHFKKPSETGGGGGSFSGFILPKQFKKTDYGTFSANVKNNQIKFIGKGDDIGKNGKTQIRAVATIKANGFTIKINN